MLLVRPVLSLSLVILPVVNALEAREGFGFAKRSASITRTRPPAIRASGVRVRVTGDEPLRKFVADAILAGDQRFIVASPADVDVKVSVERLDALDAWETKTDYEYRQTGTRDEWSATKGRYEKKAVYTNVPVTKHVRVVSGTLAGRYEIRDESGHLLDAGALDQLFREKYPDGDGAPSTDAVRDVLLRDAARSLAARIVPTNDTVSVLLPKGSFEGFIPLAESGHWQDYLRAVEAVPANRSHEQEAYRQYALAVAKEAIAYASADRARAAKLLAEALEHCRNAVDYLDASAPLDRIEASAKAYAAWR